MTQALRKRQPIKLSQRPFGYTLNPEHPLIARNQLIWGNFGRGFGSNRMWDESGKYQPGTLTNFANPTWKYGIGRSALAFNGSNNYVNLNYGIMSGRSQYSIAFWAYGASYPGAAQPCICFTTSTTGTTWYFYPYDTTNNGPRLYTEGGGGSNTTQFSVACGLGWNHFCITQSTTTSRALYINGAPVTSSVQTFSFPAVAMSFTLGGSYQRYVQYSPATLADVMVFANALPSSVIAHIASPNNVMLDTGGITMLLPPNHRSSGYMQRTANYRRRRFFLGG